MSESTTSVAPSSRKAFTFRSIVGRTDRAAEPFEKTGKGPIGLTTIFEPDEPGIVDIIFVHGLNGGSKGTWTQNGDPALFWPETWLSKDEAFRDVRIHTFGYNSNWGERSILDINDFATSLLASIQTSPTISQDESMTPMIFVAHSMGGLVIKRAYILSNEKKEFESISNRTLSMLFLGTPHRGSENAEFLTRLQAISGGASLPFAKDLHRNSAIIRSINDDFPRVAPKLQLYTFFESQPISYGVGKGIIVDKECAVLGYPNETASYLNGNHRTITRFSSPSDSSYISIRNALASTISLLRDNRYSTRQRKTEAERQTLEDFLGVSDGPENILSDLTAAYLEGTGEWLLSKDSFLRWKNSSCNHLLWLQGKPGAGKSVLSACTINELKASEVPKDCCYYFFTHSDRPRCTIAAFLLSMAWQMALLHTDVFNAISGISKAWKDAEMGAVDHNPIWRRLFLDGILKAKLSRTQYWIVDGLDECNNEAELVGILSKVQEYWPLSILITSRNSVENLHTLQQTRLNVVEERIQPNSTKADIELFVAKHMDFVPARDDTARAEIAHEIIQKSMGSFLWVKLVLLQLQKAHVHADAKKVLDTVPSDMNTLYTRILDSMSQEPYGKRLAKAILRWAACSSRPITTLQLNKALELDLNDKVLDVEKAVATHCGHLVYFDEQSKLRLVHSTTRQFLTDPTIDSEFCFESSQGHKSLALACLKYLSGSEILPVKSRRLQVPTGDDRSPFLEYASVALFDHIAKSMNHIHEFVSPLVAFLESSNVLYWIEHLAKRLELSRLLQAGKTLGRILKHADVAPIAGISTDMKALASWSVDLVRLVSKFGKQLSSHPEAIHSIIPPFCPQESALYRRFASTRGLHLLGSVNAVWDDCSAILSFGRGETVTTVATTELYFAVGTLIAKSIVIYDARTCQEVKRLNNGESVMSLTFGKTGKFLASAGPKSVKVWAVDTWTLVTHIPTPVRCVSLELIENDDLLLIAMRNNLLIFWDIDKDCVNDELRWTLDPAAIADYDMRVPMSITVSRTQGLLAASYRSQDLLVWNLAEDMVHDIYCRVTNGSRLDDPLGRREKSTVLAMAFSEGPDSNALLASYFDGELVLYDTKNGTLRHRLSGVNAQCMSSSPDGRTLATGDAAGTIQIFDLETLKFLYRINFNAEFIGVRALSFTSDGQRLLDLRGRQCRAWEPLVLLRQEVAEPAADTMSLSASAHEVDFEGPMDIVYITAVAIIQTGSLQTGNLVIYGTDDGVVYWYDPIRGEKMGQLFKNDIAITFLSYDAESGIITCTDQSSRVVCRRLIISRSSAWAAEVVFEVQLENAIMQVLVNYGATRLLISTANESVLFSLSSGSQNAVRKINWGNEADGFCWVATTSSNDKLILCRRGRSYIYLWDTLTLCGSFPEGIPAEDNGKFLDAGATLEGTGLFNKVVRAKTISDSDFFATISEDTRFGKIKTEVWLWKFDAFTPGTSTIQPVQGLEELKSSIDHVIGTYLNRFIFLHSNGWVCSTSLDTPDVENLVQHFFIPSDWLSLSHRPLIDVMPSGDIIFAKKSEMVVIKSGLGLSRRSLTSRHSSQSSVGRPSGLRRRSSPGGQSGLSRRQLSPSGFSIASASTLVGGGRSLRHGSLPDRSKLDEER